MNTKYLASLALAIAFTGFAAAPIRPDANAASSQTQPRASLRDNISEKAKEKSAETMITGRLRRRLDALNVNGMESVLKESPKEVVSEDTTRAWPRITSEHLAALGGLPELQEDIKKDKVLPQPLAPGLVKR